LMGSVMVHALQPQRAVLSAIVIAIYCCLCFEVNVGVPEEGS
jgi:hypothetical protein